jgi:hypothetical protein
VILSALNAIYHDMDHMRVMCLSVIGIYIVHIIIVGRVLDMDIYDAMRRVTNQTWRRINGKRWLPLTTMIRSLRLLMIMTRTALQSSCSGKIASETVQYSYRVDIHGQGQSLHTVDHGSRIKCFSDPDAF